jgi:alkanesulfonate monooxygenase SsuD/methylene tetrahydromethanopterin reductase-like flavin-dependent oxidoreductase (luciferase family)
LTPLSNMKSIGRRHNLLYGLYVPNFGRSAEPTVLSEMALEAERSGWDGFFLWDHLVEWTHRVPIYDSFTTLAAIAVKTRRIRIGTTVTPLPRLKPWSVARQTTSLDHLSNGRIVLGVGLGVKESCDYSRFGEAEDNKVLAEKLDESLDIITGLWTGKPFNYNGKHYRLQSSVFLPRPKQKPRIPIWVAGSWPRKAPFRRAAKWDGVIPLMHAGRLMNTDALRDVVEYLRSIRSHNRHFDVANIGWTTGVNRKKDAEKVISYAEAGMTWWLESLYTKRDSPEAMKKQIRLGPPRVP